MDQSFVLTIVPWPVLMIVIVILLSIIGVFNFEKSWGKYLIKMLFTLPFIFVWFAYSAWYEHNDYIYRLMFIGIGVGVLAIALGLLGGCIASAGMSEKDIPKT